MNRLAKIKNFVTNLAVLTFTYTLKIIGFGLRQIVKFAGLDPDTSPYQKYLVSMQAAMAATHDNAYDVEFDISKYRKPLSTRPSFKFEKNPKKEPSLKYTESTSPKELLELVEKSSDFIEETKKVAILKNLVTQIKKAGEESTEKVIKTKRKPKKIIKSAAKKLVK